MPSPNEKSKLETILHSTIEWVWNQPTYYMKRMPSHRLPKLTPEILQGAAQCGVTLLDLARQLHLPVEQLNEMFGGSKRLTLSQIGLIEKATGRGVGELAVLGMSANASPQQRKANSELISSTLSLMAVFGQSTAASPKPTRRTKPSRSGIRTAG
jgi:hypothetical protein